MATTADIKRYMSQFGHSEREISDAIARNKVIARQRRRAAAAGRWQHAAAVKDDMVRARAGLSVVCASWENRDSLPPTIMLLVRRGDGHQGQHDTRHRLEDLLRAAKQPDTGDGLVPLYRALVRQAADQPLGSGDCQHFHVIDQARHSTAGELPEWAYWR